MKLNLTDSGAKAAAKAARQQWREAYLVTLIKTAPGREILNSTKEGRSYLLAHPWLAFEG